MIKRVFACYSFLNRNDYKDFHDVLRRYLNSKGVVLYAFVFDFKEKLDDHKLMETALNEIDKSDLILAELTNKSVGVGLEVGYAKAKGKIIGYLYKKDSELQQTVNGISDYIISYNKAEDVIDWFENSQILANTLV